MAGGDNNRSIQVLNISNVNAQGKTVLNDGKLLELIQLYPFLYNPRVKPYGDMDYTLWAWKRINGAFNRSYENDPFAAFSISDLMNRWLVLKPLIQCLSKAYDLAAIPPTLRHSVMKISTELDDPSSNYSQKTNTMPQTMLTQKMSAIEELSREQRLAMESDILDMIFSIEIESKQLKKLEETDIAQAKQETDEFLNEIGFKQVLLTALSQQTKMFNSNSVKEFVCKTEDIPETSGKWVPLGDAHKHTRPCFVKMKRMNLEDYLPLSKIISLRRKYNQV